jgi:uncharacterized protein YecT (DUF1311 family)
MKKLIVILIVVIFTCPAFAQDFSDSEQMKSQPYMIHADKANCDNMDGNNAEHKICLNLEFQEKDSIMNTHFLDYVKKIENDTVKNTILEYQKVWVTNRRIESSIEAEGYSGHMFSIAYISTMIFITDKRIEELKYLIEYN